MVVVCMDCCPWCRLVDHLRCRGTFWPAQLYTWIARRSFIPWCLFTSQHIYWGFIGVCSCIVSGSVLSVHGDYELPFFILPFIIVLLSKNVSAILVVFLVCAKLLFPCTLHCDDLIGNFVYMYACTFDVCIELLLT